MIHFIHFCIYADVVVLRTTHVAQKQTKKTQQHAVLSKGNTSMEVEVCSVYNVLWVGVGHHWYKERPW